jgi:hypothetical protein
MIEDYFILSLKNLWKPVLLLFVLLVILVNNAKGQGPEPPPVIDATVSQNLSFGAFTTSPGLGSVTILTDGSRSTNNVLGIGIGYANAIYHVSTNRPALLSILKGPDVLLTGSNGGSMNLHIGDTDPGSPFLVPHPPGYVDIKVGGTLTVGTALANPPGSYNGTFYITFIWE